MKRRLPRTVFPPSERRRRSRIAELAHSRRLLRGTLSVRSLTCGKSNCRCARGDLHVYLYVVQSHDGKPRQLYVPREWEGQVRQAVEDYQELQRLVEGLSELEWQRLIKQKE
ncbi:MAG: hypothetical protein HYT78_07655 [Deltaproteobacteria bacterium]|nr:hypothetical protein [Deltaproteobacteria bacterium]